MNGKNKGTLLALAVVALLVVGVGSALAAGGPRGFGGGPQPGLQNGAGYGLMSGGVVMDAAAEYIGISETALITERHAGTSLAQIATGHGKTVAGLETALVSAFKANLDKAVSAGSLSQAQADQRLAYFKTQVHTLVTRTGTGPGMGMGRAGGMMGGRGGDCLWR